MLSSVAIVVKQTNKLHLQEVFFKQSLLKHNKFQNKFLFTKNTDQKILEIISVLFIKHFRALVSQSVSQSVSRLVGQSFSRCFVGWSVGWSVSRSVGRLVGWSVGQSVSQSVGRLVGQ